MTDYKPGLYRVDSWRGSGLLAFRVLDRAFGWVALDGTDTRGLEEREVSNIRPLVALDLSAYTTEAVVSGMRDAMLDILARQIEEQTRPAIEEPQGLGAVVRDRDGLVWQRIDADTPWFNKARFDKNWNELDVAEVLSEGWLEGAQS